MRERKALGAHEKSDLDILALAFRACERHRMNSGRYCRFGQAHALGLPSRFDRQHVLTIADRLQKVNPLVGADAIVQLAFRPPIVQTGERREPPSFTLLSLRWYAQL